MRALLFLLLFIAFTACKKDNGQATKTEIKDTVQNPVKTKAEPGNDNPVAFNFSMETLGGWLKIGLDEKTLKEKAGSDYKVNVLGESQVSGLYEEEWTYAKQGIKLVMESDTDGSEKKIAQITVSVPSKLKTLKNIGLGSTRKEVIAAYHGEINTEEATDDTIIVGSVYEGLFFTMKNDIVDEIFIGAIAE